MRTADRRQPVPEAAAVHPKCEKSSSGVHARPSHAKEDTPHCSVIPASYCRRPDPPQVPLRGVVGGGTAIIYVVQDGI
jgi:hypothetical protein